MKKTGEILRKSREEKGLSLHEVGIFLKINTRILQAIEDGDIEKLPAKTFLRGFVQSYAKYLKLDPNYVLKIFSDELRPPPTEAEVLLEEKLPPPTEVPFTEPESEPALETQDSEVSAPAEEPKSSLYVGASIAGDSVKQKMLIISVLGFLLVFIVYIGNNLIRRYQKEARLNADIPVVENVETETVSAPETLSSTPVTENPLTALPKVSPSQDEAKPITPANNSTTTITNTAPAPETAAKAPSPTANSAPTEKKIPEGKPLEVIIEAKESVEIEYSSARTSPQKLLLKSDQIHTFKSRSGVRLKISNGGAVNVIVNGQDLGAPGAQGQSIQLNYE
jgi:cytoskeleton protein RodZ